MTQQPRAFLAPCTALDMSMAMVIGPTPPGTGVICEATALASAKFTSPTSLYPRFLVASCAAA
eukprot:scaffold648002_cov39-Prasinocladus_malaysianus.AAC.1